MTERARLLQQVRLALWRLELHAATHRTPRSRELHERAKKLIAEFEAEEAKEMPRA